MQETIRFASTPVGQEHQPFVVAEMSGNHNGDLERALDIVRAVAEAGAHALKLQTYTRGHDHRRRRLPGVPAVRRSTSCGAARGSTSSTSEAHTPWEWHEPIFELAARARAWSRSPRRSTPPPSTFLEKLDVPPTRSPPTRSSTSR